MLSLIGAVRIPPGRDLVGVAPGVGRTWADVELRSLSVIKKTHTYEYEAL